MTSLKAWWDYIVSNSSVLVEQTVNHAKITAIVVIIATLVSLVLAVIVHRSVLLRTVAVSVAGIFLTLPSLALFALFIPIFGIGNRPAIVAMTMYAILPILRNAITGLSAVSPAVVESAKGMGMSNMQQLFRIRLPLAYPLIMAGVRVATLLTVGIAAIAVLVGGDGLGYFIQLGISQQGFPFANYAIYTGLLFTVLLGLAFDSILAGFQRLTTARGLQV